MNNVKLLPVKPLRFITIYDSPSITIDVSPDTDNRIGRAWYETHYSGKALVEVGTQAADWLLSLLHELGHIIHRKEYPYHFAHRELYRNLFIREVMAWRIAKSMAKPHRWDELTALTCLHEYANYYGIKVHWEKLRILPI
jgi:hypothetical protein